jgi:hypothetical protein
MTVGGFILSPNPLEIEQFNLQDFHTCALLDLVDKTLSKIHAKIVKTNWDDAMHLLEALTLFNELEGFWTSEYNTILLIYAPIYQ